MLLISGVILCLSLFPPTRARDNATVRGCAGQSHFSPVKSPSQCQVSGVNGSPCIFPFDYYGTVYYACVWVSSPRCLDNSNRKAALSQQSFIPEGWCATRVDGSGAYTGDWEECNSECPVCKTVDSEYPPPHPPCLTDP